MSIHTVAIVFLMALCPLSTPTFSFSVSTLQWIRFICSWFTLQAFEWSGLIHGLHVWLWWFSFSSSSISILFVFIITSLNSSLSKRILFISFISIYVRSTTCKVYSNYWIFKCSFYLLNKMRFQQIEPMKVLWCFQFSYALNKFALLSVLFGFFLDSFVYLHNYIPQVNKLCCATIIIDF